MQSQEDNRGTFINSAGPGKSKGPSDETKSNTEESKSQETKQLQPEIVVSAKQLNNRTRVIDEDKV